MQKKKLVAVKCRFERAVLRGERVFRVSLANGTEYKSITPIDFCWDNSNNHLVETSSADGGWIAGRLIDDDLDGGQVAVEVPDGEVLAVRSEEIVARPTAIIPPGVMARA